MNSATETQVEAVGTGAPTQNPASRGELRPGPRGGFLAPPFAPGNLANPGGRPKAQRTVTAALTELQDTPGETPEDSVAAFRAARGAKLCGADHRAIALHLQACDRTSRLQVAAADSYADRVEGRVVVRTETEATTVALFRPINLPELPAACATVEILASMVEEP